jgi:short-subunit dehydrogenase
MLAVITGASSGIGKEIAYRLAEKNYDLILIARRIDRLESIKKDLSKLPINVEILAYDISDLDKCKLLINHLKTNKPDIFVNNAGYGIYGDSFNTDTSKEIEMIGLNITTLHFLTKELIQFMDSGTIINISSMAAFLPTPLLASYAATKAYVYSYSQALNYELKKSKKDIRIMTVCPGPVKTEFNQVANADPKMKGITVEQCVDSIMNGLKRNKALVIPSFKMKFLRFIMRIVPTSLILKVSYQVQNKK